MKIIASIKTALFNSVYAQHWKTKGRRGQRG